VVASQTRMDRRLLLRACRLLRRLPTLDAAVRDHRISFAQLRGLTIGLRSVGAEADGEIDRLVGSLLDGLARLERPDPDVLVRQVVDALDELAPEDLASRERAANGGRFLHLQPRLDGTGGRVVGEFDAAGMALLDAATTPSAELLDAAGSYGAARLDTLLARLARAGTEPSHDDLASDGNACDATWPGRLASGDRGDTAPGWWEGLAPPQLLVRLPLEALLDERVPADLLTTLTGGRLRLTSPAARRLVDRAGARLRAIVVDDDGTVLGVGRARRQPPGWLTDVVAAVHDTCTGPGCDRAARGAELDHARPWWPARPAVPAGTTDLDNLGPLCARTNRAKEEAGWHVAQTADGTRTWVHHRSGLTTTTVPASWRPPGDPRRRRPSRPEPPGRDRAGLHPAATSPDAPGGDHRDVPHPPLPF
jgi:hypothetical protein